MSSLTTQHSWNASWPQRLAGQPQPLRTPWGPFRTVASFCDAAIYDEYEVSGRSGAGGRRRRWPWGLDSETAAREKAVARFRELTNPVCFSDVLLIPQTLGAETSIHVLANACTCAEWLCLPGLGLMMMVMMICISQSMHQW
jgi:hypothetical protein